MRGALLFAVLFSSVAIAAPRRSSEVAPLTAAPESQIKRALDEASCSGEYADAMLVLSSDAREFERRPESNYSYCLRNTATYECLSYGADGKIRRKPITVVAHGTAFAYREKAGEYFLLTNEHVATWPTVTDEEHEVSDVPAGCKKVDEELRLVRNESDDYEPGHIVVQKVVSDPLLDASVLKTRQQLNVMPYRVGRSALLKAGNVVQVRGYPLGLLQATNSGKVVSAADLDREKGWYHSDFVVDALVTKGNSGSPVFAVSCRTGALELVGLYHAGYKGSPALNAVVGIDQLRDLMDNFRKSKLPAGDRVGELTPEERKVILDALKDAQVLPYFKIGDRMARLRLLDEERVAFDVFSEAFPAKDLVALTLEETRTGGIQSFVVFGETTPARKAGADELDAEGQEIAHRLHEILERQFLLTLRYRAASRTASRSRETYRQATELAKQLDARRLDGVELLKSVNELALRMPVVGGSIRSNTPRELAEDIAGVASGLTSPSVPASRPTPATK
jgi:serine protease Do